MIDYKKLILQKYAECANKRGNVTIGYVRSCCHMETLDFNAAITWLLKKRILTTKLDTEVSVHGGIFNGQEIKLGDPRNIVKARK